MATHFKRILTIAALLCSLGLHAAIVTGNFQSNLGSNYNGTFVVTNTVNPQVIGTNIIVGKSTTIQLVNAAFTNYLVAGSYVGNAAGYSIKFNVPNDTSPTVYRLENLATNLTTYTYTNIGVFAVAAGNGATASTNNGLVTISANLTAATNNDTVVSNGVINTLLIASNLSVITISNQASLPSKPDLSGITGRFPGQPLVTYGGGAGGGIHQLFFWNTNNGAASWDGGLMVPGNLVAYGSGVNHILIVTNGADNALELRNTDLAHYSAARFTDAYSVEKGAVGYGNTNAPIYPGVDYMEDYGNGQGFYFAYSGFLAGGLQRFAAAGNSAGNFVWLNGTATNDSLTNVVFQIKPSGAVRISGSLTVSNAVGIEGILRVGPGATTGSGLPVSTSDGHLNTGSLDPSQNATVKRVLFQNGSGQANSDIPAIDIAGNGTGWDAKNYFLTAFVQGRPLFRFEDVGTYCALTNACSMGFGGTPNTTCSQVDIQSTTKGLLLPRMTKAQRNAIVSPVAGLAIYQTDNTPGLRVYNGTNWMRYTETAD